MLVENSSRTWDMSEGDKMFESVPGKKGIPQPTKEKNKGTKEKKKKDEENKPRSKEEEKKNKRKR